MSDKRDELLARVERARAIHPHRQMIRDLTKIIRQQEELIGNLAGDLALARARMQVFDQCAAMARSGGAVMSERVGADGGNLNNAETLQLVARGRGRAYVTEQVDQAENVAAQLEHEHTQVEAALAAFDAMVKAYQSELPGIAETDDVTVEAP